MRSVYIAYGFSEGKWNSRRLRKAMRSFNFTPTNSLESADFVLAHSGGCIDLPPLREQQTLVLINPTYWPGKAKSDSASEVFHQNLHETLRGRQRLYHVVKFFNFLWCFVSDARRNMTMSKRVDEFNLAAAISHPRTLLIRNHGDPWLTADLSALQTANPNLKIHSLEGYHDDCWMNPAPYLKIMSESS